MSDEKIICTNCNEQDAIFKGKEPQTYFCMECAEKNEDKLQYGESPLTPEEQLEIASEYTKYIAPEMLSLLQKSLEFYTNHPKSEKFAEEAIAQTNQQIAHFESIINGTEEE